MNNFTYKDLQVLDEDNHIIVVEKPQGVPSQSDKTMDVDMLSIVKEYIKVNENKPGEAYVGLVHRLDRPTGGVMVFAKTSKAAARLSEQFKDKDTDECEKVYYCVTCGIPKTKTGELHHYLVKDERTNTSKVVPMANTNAQEAILRYEVLATLASFSLCKVVIDTGRHHQIRAQMAAIGCPLFGDKKYGAPLKTIGAGLALWAVKLSFIHPTTKERRTYFSYPPTETIPWREFEVNRFIAHDVVGSNDQSYRQALEEVKKNIIK